MTLDGPERARRRSGSWCIAYGGDEQAAGAARPGTERPAGVVPFSCKDVYLERYARPDKGWTDRDEAHWPVPYWDIDTGFTALLMLLAAVDEGLGALVLRYPAGPVR